MLGFDNKALILFPKEENYSNKPSLYKIQFRNAYKNLCAYLESVGITPHAFYTDDLAREFNNGEMEWVSTLNTAERFFVSKHCVGMADAMKPMLEFPEVYQLTESKDPSNPKGTEDEKFDLVLRHNTRAANAIIPKYKIVIHFAIPKRAQYKVAKKPNDGKIRIDVSATTFVPTAYFSGNVENMNDLLDAPYANRALDNWGLV